MIQDTPVPEEKKQVQSSLGLAGYNKKLLPNYAEVATPLTDLTKKRQPNKVPWEEPQQIAFQKLKDMLRSTQVLQMPNFDKPFIVQADASDIGIDTVRSQEHPDELLPVLYGS